MIIFKRPDPLDDHLQDAGSSRWSFARGWILLDDHLQEARSSRWSFASRWILRMIICKRGARGVRVGGCYRTKINFLMFPKWISMWIQYKSMGGKIFLILRPSQPSTFEIKKHRRPKKNLDQPASSYSSLLSPTFESCCIVIAFLTVILKMHYL